MTRIAAIDLFSGAGGLGLGARAAGLDVLLHLDNDSDSCATLRHNRRFWGDSEVLQADVREVSGVSLRGRLGLASADPLVIIGGAPCQPFSKSGAQRGMEETRGTLYWNILRIVQERRPAIVMLENVRNLAGPRHRHEWQVIVETLRTEGYRVSETPAIFSPHLLPRDQGGRPQVRERVFVTASRLPEGRGLDLDCEPAVTNRPVSGWDPKMWNLEDDLPLDDDHDVRDCQLSESEQLWINAWDDFVQVMWETRDGRRLPCRLPLRRAQRPAGTQRRVDRAIVSEPLPSILLYFDCCESRPRIIANRARA